MKGQGSGKTSKTRVNKQDEGLRTRLTDSCRGIADTESCITCQKVEGTVAEIRMPWYQYRSTEYCKAGKCARSVALPGGIAFLV